MPPHRIGIIGCSPRGLAFAAAVASLDESNLVLSVDDDLAAAQACTGAYGGVAALGWNGQALDTLIVTHPRAWTSPACWTQRRTGVQVLVDPPLARGVVDARRAVRTVQGVPGRVGMAFDWRFEPLMRLLRALLPRPLFAHISVSVDPGAPLAPESVRQSVWTTPHHALDLLMHLFDGPPAEIVADGGPLPAPRGGTAMANVPARADAMVADLFFDRERHASLTVAGGGADPDLGPVSLDVTDGVTRARIWSNWTAAEVLPLDGRSLDPPRMPGVRTERMGRALQAMVEPDGSALRALVQALIDAESTNAPLPGLPDGARAVR